MNENFRDYSPAVMALLDAEIIKVLHVVGNLVVRSAQDHARRDTGNMANSINYRITIDGGRWLCTVASPANYSIYNELGTRKMSAQPFMYPGLAENVNKIDSLFKRIPSVLRNRK